jgi:tetratricopeptide (TPR) repeat protein
LSSLVDKALVTLERTPAGERYVLSASIRTFASQRARELNEWRSLSLRHARYFRERAAALQAAYSTRQWRENLETMLPELDNLRAALIFTVLERNDVRLGAELSCDLVEYWQHLGRNTAGREWIDQLLSRVDAKFSKLILAKLHYGLARLDSARSKRALDAALHSAALYRELGDDAGLAGALFEAAAAATGIGQSDAADPYLDEALAIAKRIGDVRRMADVLNGKALAENWRGNAQRARALFEESLQLFRQLEDDRGVASLLGNLGDLSATVGEYDRAVSLSRQSLAILERLHDAQSTGWQLLNLGAFELKRGNVDAARPALRRALELVREYQDDWLSANCLDCLSRLALVEKDWRRALRLAGFADGVLESIGVPRQPPDQLDYENVLQQAQSAVGERAPDVMKEGRAMGWGQAVKEALQV